MEGGGDNAGRRALLGLRKDGVIPLTPLLSQLCKLSLERSCSHHTWHGCLDYLHKSRGAQKIGCPEQDTCWKVLQEVNSTFHFGEHLSDEHVPGGMSVIGIDPQKTSLIEPCPTPTTHGCHIMVFTSLGKQMGERTMTIVYLSQGFCPLQNAWWPSVLREDKGSTSGPLLKAS